MQSLHTFLKGLISLQFIRGQGIAPGSHLSDHNVVVEGSLPVCPDQLLIRARRDG